MSLPIYETKLVSVPVVTQVRRRSLPTRHIGPWPIKRSRSEADYNILHLGLQTEGMTEKVDLRAVLRKVDEECAAIDRALIGKEVAHDDKPSNDKERSCWKSRGSDSINRIACNILAVFMGLAFTLVFGSTPIITFTFANAAWGKIHLDVNAPSRLVLAVLLCLTTTAVGFGFAMAATALMCLRYRWDLLARPQQALLAVSISLCCGALLSIWVLAWLMPLIAYD